MITGRQIRAARALLDMSQDQLAKLAGLTPQAIRKIEDGSVQPREGTIADITKVFAEQRLEFTDHEGVRFRPEGIDVLEGAEGFEQFYDRVYMHVKKYGGLICVSGVDEEQFAQHHGADHAEAHLTRMAKLTEARKDISFQILIKEGDLNFLADAYAAYRWQPKEFFTATPFYLFGDNLALITFDAEPAPRILIIRSPVFAEAYRKQFQIAWNTAKVPPKRRTI